MLVKMNVKKREGNFFLKSNMLSLYPVSPNDVFVNRFCEPDVF